ncbi:MAG: nitroreductase family protein [Eubacteriales bacterium]|nr:nitroreductase family protein [Eubacteriales bacterium]
MNVLQTMLSRRSARGFLPKPVPEEALRDMLLAAQAAPTGGNAQSHVFGVIRDPAQREALCTRAAGNALWKQSDWLLTAPVIIACCARLDEDMRAAAPEDYVLQVNRLRFGGKLMDYLLRYDDWKEMALLFADGVPLIPAEHMFLAAVSHGLSACFIGYLDVKEAGRILGLPDDMACLYLMPVGYPAAEPGPKKLKPLSEISFADHWRE